MDLRDKRDLYNGFGDGLGRAFELAVTPAVFGLVGYVVDRWLGTKPLFLIVFVLVAVCEQGWMMWRRYDADMRRHEADAVWNRPATPTSGEAA